MINANLAGKKLIKSLREYYGDNNPKGIQISGFMDKSSYAEFLQRISSVKFRKEEQRDTHSYFEATPLALSFFNSNEFRSFASAVTGKKLSKASCTLKIFLSGSYTLLHDNPPKGIEFYLDLTPAWKKEWGGSTFLVTKEGEKLMLPPTPNTLTLADAGSSYIKYVNCLAKSEGRLVVHGILR